MTVQAVRDDPSYSGTVQCFSWLALNQGNLDGSPVAWSEYADRCITVTGTFGTATLTIQGSNDLSNWFSLRDTSNLPMAITAPALHQALELTKYVRPLVTGADGTTNLTATLLMRRNWK